MTRRPKARFKREKCRYKRCTHKRLFPVDNPRYCGKHVDIVLGTIPKLSITEKIKTFVLK